MISLVRRAVAGVVAALVVLLGVSVPSLAVAETASATPTPSAASTTTPGSGAAQASAAESAADSSDDSSGPDDSQGAAPDDSRQAWALGAAGLLAVIAAAVVLLRR